MSVFALRNAWRRRMARIRQGGESGFALLYVLMISTVVTVLTGTVLVATGGDIIPSVRNTFDEAAYAAAQGGVQSFVTYADTSCTSAYSSVATCTLPSNFNSGTIYTGSGYTASYTWAAQKDSSNRYFRVRSTGTVQEGGLTVTRTLVADVAGGASSDVLNYGVVTGFETQSPLQILSNFHKRTISLNCTAVTASGAALNGNKCKTDSSYLDTLNWNGASPGSAAGKLAVCNMQFAGTSGRSNDLPPGAPNPYVDWSENATGSASKYTDYQSCTVSFGTGTKLLAPANPGDGAGGYFTDDAMLLSNSYPGGTGPLFNQPVTTKYQATAADGACATVGQTYRSFDLACAGFPVEVGGSPSPSSAYGVQWVPYGPQIPSSSPTLPSGTCIYNGPTRVKLNSDGTATVTSPQTTATWAATQTTVSAQCYTGASDISGMAFQSVNLTAPTAIKAIYVQNDGKVPPSTPALAATSTGWNTTGQKLGSTPSAADTVFYNTTGTAGTTTATAVTTTAADAGYTAPNGDNPSTHADGSWTPQWTSVTGNTNCTTSTATTDLRLLNCYYGTSGSAYPSIKSTVQAALAAAPSSYTSASALQTYLTSVLSAANSSDANNSAPTYIDNRSHRWKVSVATDASATDGCTPGTTTGSTTNTTIGAPTSDPMYSNHAGNSAATPTTTTTCLTASVTAQIGTCNVALVFGVCVNLGNYVWGNGTALLGGGQSVAQFKVTVTSKSVSTATTVTPSSSYFPDMADVTQYGIGKNGAFDTSGPGDLYVEGTASSSMALIAGNDVIVTGALAPADTTNNALEVVSYDDVRVYHPVQCLSTNASAIAATDPGWCPNDITGLYSKVLTTGSRPDQQYTNMRPDLANLAIHAAIFALGIPQSNVNCPEPPTGNSGVCGGEFGADNYNRGDSVGTTSLGTITVVGTIAMAHHGPVGEEWEVPDQAGLSSRPYSGYELAVQYQNLKNALAGINVLTTISTTSSLWHVISVSSQPSS